MNIKEPLKKLGLLGATKNSVYISSTEIIDYISKNDESAKEIFKELEKQGLIKISGTLDDQLAMITEKGFDILKKEYSDYKFIFSAKDNYMKIKGTVTTGLGEGQYYMLKEGYINQFSKILAFKPYPGTLNVLLDSQNSNKHQKFKKEFSIRINGFTSNERTFGGGLCYPVEIGGIYAGILVPDRSHYPSNLVEIIAPVNLRETLNLEDGDDITITVNSSHDLNGDYNYEC